MVCADTWRRVALQQPGAHTCLHLRCQPALFLGPPQSLHAPRHITELITQCIRPADEPGTPDMSDAGETTDDGCESPILCVSRTATYAAKAVKCAVPPHNRPEEAGSTEGDEADEADEADGANGADEADDANEADDADEGRDVFDSQGRRFYGPALQANNVMRLLDHAWFRAECDHTLRTRLALHCRDCFDLVSKYLLALKAR